MTRLQKTAISHLITLGDLIARGRVLSELEEKMVTEAINAVNRGKMDSATRIMYNAAVSRLGLKNVKVVTI